MNTTPRKKRNFIGAADCRVWFRDHLARGTYYKADENGEIPATLADAELARRFGIVYKTVQNIREANGIPSYEERIIILAKMNKSEKPSDKLRPVDIYNLASVIGVTIILATIIVYLLTR